MSPPPDDEPVHARIAPFGDGEDLVVEADSDQVEELPDGSTVMYGARCSFDGGPIQYRDVIRWANGDISIGINLTSRGGYQRRHPA